MSNEIIIPRVYRCIDIRFYLHAPENFLSSFSIRYFYKILYLKYDITYVQETE